MEPSITLIKNNFFLSVAFLLFIFSRAVFADSSAITAIEIHGNKRIDTKAIRNHIAIAVGDQLDTTAVSKDIKSLYAMGFFDNIVVYQEETSEGIALMYQLTEKPRIKAVIFEGTKSSEEKKDTKNKEEEGVKLEKEERKDWKPGDPEDTRYTYKVTSKKKFETKSSIKEEDIQEKIETKAYEYLSRAKLMKDAKTIEGLYNEKGYFLIEVTPKVEPISDDEVNVIFNIYEGEKAELKKINFIGNTRFTDDELKAIIKTKEGWLFSGLSSSSFTNFNSYKEDDFIIDKELVTRKYLNNGYINIDVKEPQLALSPDKRWIFIDINIVEGDQYDLKSIDVDGDFIKPKEEIRELIKSKTNQTFNYEDIQKDIQRLTVFYQDAGYAYVNVIPKNKVDNEHLLVDLTFTIEKGPLVYIEKINITGNDFTRDKVIRRELQIIEQDLYSITKIKESEFYIRRFSYIKDVKVTESPGSKSDTIILNFALEEQSRGTFQVGAAFNSVDSFMFQGQIQKTNLFGYGWSINFYTQLGSRSKVFSLNFVDPYFLDTNVSMSVSGYNTFNRRLNFSERKLGSSLVLGYPIYKKIYRASLGYKFEDVGVADFNETRALLFKDGVTSSSTAGISRDTRNKISFFETTDGALTTAQSELAGSHVFGGDNSFLKLSFEHRQFFQLFKDSTLPLISDSNFQFRGRLGYITSVTGETIPIFERFFQGGLFSLRGYEISSIGPSIQVATSSDPDVLTDERFVIGGNKEVLFNFEYIVPILKEQGLKFVTFFDTGNAYNNGEIIDPRDLRSDIGFGIRWFTPIAPLTFEWGFPLDRREGEGSFVFNFMLGTPF